MSSQNGWNSVERLGLILRCTIACLCSFTIHSADAGVAFLQETDAQDLLQPSQILMVPKAGYSESFEYLVQKNILWTWRPSILIATRLDTGRQLIWLENRDANRSINPSAKRGWCVNGYLVVAYPDSIELRDDEKGKLVHVLPAANVVDAHLLHSDLLVTLAIVNPPPINSTFLPETGLKYHLQFWDMATAQLIDSSLNQIGYPVAFTISSDERYLAAVVESANDDRDRPQKLELGVWQIPSGDKLPINHLSEFAKPSGWLSHFVPHNFLLFTPQNDRLLICCYENHKWIEKAFLSLATGTKQTVSEDLNITALYNLTRPQPSFVQRTTDIAHLSPQLRNGKLEVLDWTTGNRLYECPLPSETSGNRNQRYSWCKCLNYEIALLGHDDQDKNQHYHLIDYTTGHDIGQIQGRLLSNYQSIESNDECNLLMTRAPDSSDRLLIWDSRSAKRLATLEHPYLFTAQLLEEQSLIVTSNRQDLRIFEINQLETEKATK